jgi:hypothetical protein
VTALRGGEELTAQLADMLVRCGIERGVLGHIDADNVARILLPIVRRYGDQRAAEALRYFADLIDRGPTFPLPPGIFSAMARERANDPCGAGE